MQQFPGKSGSRFYREFSVVGIIKRLRNLSSSFFIILLFVNQFFYFSLFLLHMKHMSRSGVNRVRNDGVAAGWATVKAGWVFTNFACVLKPSARPVPTQMLPQVWNLLVVKVRELGIVVISSNVHQISDTTVKVAIYSPSARFTCLIWITQTKGRADEPIKCDWLQNNDYFDRFMELGLLW